MDTSNLRAWPLLAALTVLLASGCSETYRVGSGVPGTLTIDTPGSIPPLPPAAAGPGGQGLGPPGNLLGASAQPASLTRPVSGPYRGRGEAMNDPGGACTLNVPVTNWVVTGDQVSFGRFNGVIQPDGSLTMQAGPMYVQGRYIGSHFTGQYWGPQPSCTYAIQLDPIG